MLLVNLVGEPGAGKTTAAAGLFHRLKLEGYNVEMVAEYSKELWISGEMSTLSDELLVFAEKYRRISRLRAVDIVISDSPLINSVVYGGDQFGPAAKAFYQAVAESFDSIYLVVRGAVPRNQLAYNPFGRTPDPADAHACGEAIITAVEALGKPSIEITSREHDINRALSFVLEACDARNVQPFGVGGGVAA